ncbi:MAG: PCRF domain-containing protein, partial [Clostridia bacterium]|nr:PCRF domain-containing protein [Clostridia bacterium]
MLQFEELILKLNGLKPQLDELFEALAIESAKKEIEKLEAQSGEAGFWDDMQKSQEVLKKLSGLKSRVASYEKLCSSFDDAMTLSEMGNEEEDLSLFEESAEAVEQFAAKLDEMTLSTLLTGEYDANNAILTFHAGAGGTEAQDWAEMLLRMYTKWAESHGYKLKTLDYLDGDEAGLKSASILIEGENAYGYLKCESGVHRLVRVSPFDSSGRRHTSFAS